LEIRALKQSTHQFEKIIDEQGKTITDLRQREEHLQQEIADKREHTQRLDNIIEDREEQIKNQSDEIRNLRSVYVTQEDSIHKLRTSEEQLSRKIVSQTNLQAKLEKLISSKNNEILELNAQLERSNNKYLDEKKQNEAAHRSIASLKAKLDELHEVLSENAGEIRERDKKISDLVLLVEEGRLELQKERDENRVRLMIQSLVSKREELDAQIEHLTKIQDGKITSEMLKSGKKKQKDVSKKDTHATLAKKSSPVLRKKSNGLPMSQLEPDSEERNFVDEQFPTGTLVNLDGRNGKVLSDGLIQFEDGGIANLQAVHHVLNVTSQIVDEG
jgi:chromosome segregation ATPase